MTDGQPAKMGARGWRRWAHVGGLTLVGLALTVAPMLGVGRFAAENWVAAAAVVGVVIVTLGVVAAWQLPRRRKVAPRPVPSSGRRAIRRSALHRFLRAGLVAGIVVVLSVGLLVLIGILFPA